MATVSFLHNNPSKLKEGKFPVVIVVRNRGTHSHISTGIKLQPQHWDPHKLIKRGADGITDHLHENSQLLKKLADIQSFITSLTITGEVTELTAAQITARYANKISKEKYNFNTYFQYIIGTKTPSNAKLYRDTYNMLVRFHPGTLSFAHNINIPEEIIAFALGHQSAHKTTNIYIEKDVEKIDRANRKVLNQLK